MLNEDMLKDRYKELCKMYTTCIAMPETEQDPKHQMFCSNLLNEICKLKYIMSPENE